MGSHGSSWLSTTEPSCDVEEAFACRKKAAARGERTARGHGDIVWFCWPVTQTWRVVAHNRDLPYSQPDPANSAVSTAARLTCWDTLLAFSLASFQASHLQALFARNLRRHEHHPCVAWARASPFTTCTHTSVPIVRTSAPCTTLAWMKTISPVWTRGAQ